MADVGRRGSPARRLVVDMLSQHTRVSPVGAVVPWPGQTRPHRQDRDRRRRPSSVRGASLTSWRPHSPTRTATTTGAAVASRCKRWSLPASRRPPPRTAPPESGVRGRSSARRSRPWSWRSSPSYYADRCRPSPRPQRGFRPCIPYLRSARAQARRHGIRPMPCRTLNRSARIRRPPLPRLRRQRSRARPDASSLPPTAHPALAPPPSAELRPTPGGATGGWPSSPACSRSRSSSRSTPCRTSLPDTPSPATASRRPSSAPRRTRTRKQARRQR